MDAYQLTLPDPEFPLLACISAQGTGTSLLKLRVSRLVETFL
jgi:hypothetical protein